MIGFYGWCVFLIGFCIVVLVEEVEGSSVIRGCAVMIIVFSISLVVQDINRKELEKKNLQIVSHKLYSNTYKVVNSSDVVEYWEKGFYKVK